jgi:hypothetical protein
MQEVPIAVKDFMGFKEFYEKYSSFKFGENLIDYLNQEKLSDDDLSPIQKYYFYFLLR